MHARLNRLAPMIAIFAAPQHNPDIERRPTGIKTEIVQCTKNSGAAAAAGMPRHASVVP